MFNGSRFFNLARKWKKENEEGKWIKYLPMHFFILQAIMDHYFGCIAGYRNYDKHLLEFDSLYPTTEVAFVLNSVGYYNYSIEKFEKIGKTSVTLRNTL